MEEFLDYVIGSTITSFAIYLIVFSDLMLGTCLLLVGGIMVLRSIK